MKRWTLRICVLLLLGAIVNVAVAWGFAVFHPPLIYGPDRHPTQGMFNWSGTGPTWLITYMPEAGTAHLSASDVARTGGSTVSGSVQLADLPPWSVFSASTADYPRTMPCITEMARGWPCYSMGNRVEEDMQSSPRMTWTIYHAVRIPYGNPECRLGRGDGRESFIPLAVIWPGFAINTVFYAAMLWLLFAGAFALRRRLRRKRGLCPACGYRVGTSDVCTECGKPVTARKA